MSTDFLRLETNERIDITDFEFATKESLEAINRQILDTVLVDPSSTRKWILEGFAMTNPSAKELTVTKGRAILASRVAGVIQYGYLATNGDTTKTVDLNSYSAGTYGIYVRFEHVEGDSENRIFWDPAGNGSEYTQAVNTRYLANWSVRVESSNPGAEWLKIGEVDQATMAITDQRNFYFEGEIHNSYQSGWSTDGGGASNDRNSDRKTYGVTNFQDFTAAMRQCIEDIKGRGLKRWYEAGIGGLNIGFDTDPTADTIALKDANFKLYHDGTDVFQYYDDQDFVSFDRSENTWIYNLANNPLLYIKSDSIYPETTDSIALGSVSKIFSEGYFNDLDAANIFSTAYVGSDLIASVTNTYDLGSDSIRWQAGYLVDKLDITGTAPNVILKDSDGNADAKNWQMLADSDHLYIRALDDSFANPINLFDITRSGTAITEFAITSALTTFSGDILPATTGTENLGSTTYRWQNIYAKNYLDLDGIAPAIKLFENNADPDEGYFDIYVNAGALRLRALDDSYLNPVEIYKVNRTGTTIDSLDINTHVLPAGDDTYNLGSLTYSWHNLYIDQIYASTALTIENAAPAIWFKETNASADENNWRMGNDIGNFYLQAYNDALGSFNDIITITRTGYTAETIQFHGYIRPSSNTITVGSASYHWGNVYSDKLNIDDAAGNGVANHLVPTTDDSSDLGNATYQWKDLYLDGVAYIDLLVLDTDPTRGVGSSLIPSTDDTYDLGIAGREFKDLHIDGTANIDTLVLSTASGEGLGSNLIPTANATYVIGNGSYGIKNIYLAETTGTNILVNLSSPKPDIRWYESNGGTNEKYWHMYADSGIFTIEGRTDSDDTPVSLFTLERSGTSLLKATINGTCYIEENFRVKGDGGAGASGYTSYTGATASGSSGNGTVANANSNSSAGWLVVYIGTTAAYIPYWTSIS